MSEEENEHRIFTEKNQRFLQEIEMVLVSLPRWAKVAFAARCARRMLSLYSISNSSRIPEEKMLKKIQDLEKLVSITELSANRAVYASKISQEEWKYYGNPLLFEDLTVFHAIDAAYIADGKQSIYCKSVDETIMFQIRILNIIAIDLTDDTEKIRTAVLGDCKYLASKAIKHRWTEETSVHQEVFGEMWPNSKPSDLR